MKKFRVSVNNEESLEPLFSVEKEGLACAINEAYSVRGLIESGELLKENKDILFVNVFDEKEDCVLSVLVRTRTSTRIKRIVEGIIDENYENIDVKEYNILVDEDEDKKKEVLKNIPELLEILEEEVEHKNLIFKVIKERLYKLNEDDNK